MVYIARIITLIFDMFSTILFFNTMLKKKTSKFINLILCTILGIEILSGEYLSAITAGNNSIGKNILFVCFNLLFLLLISFCYECSVVRHRVFAVVSYYALGAISEIFFAIVFFTINSQLKESSSFMIDTEITFGASIINFLLVCMIITYKKKKSKAMPIKYTLLVFITPISTLLIMFIMPLYVLDIATFSSMVLPGLIGLLFVNILNYYLLDSVLENHEKDNRIKTIERQLKEQEEKYDQLSDAYKQTRRIIHDVKQHNNYVIGCLERKEYDDLADTLRTNIKEIEDKYIFANTGNLVIDTFVNNFAATCKKYDIDFQFDLSVDCDRVPIPDYDLCIIIGNLFDNCLNANNSLPDGIHKYMKVIIATKENFLVIKINNPIIPEDVRSVHNNLYHGYGLENVKFMCEKYMGLYNCKKKEDYSSTVCIPIPQSETGLRIQRATEPGLKYDIKMLKDD
ncbi:MAG: GHKL domain-containing protein [Lachnospiraceae bacterium]|nr:GHKL domain-containing protein [Lachnospiraceae bacterium]